MKFINLLGDLLVVLCGMLMAYFVICTGVLLLPEVIDVTGSTAYSFGIVVTATYIIYTTLKSIFIKQKGGKEK